jgi:three-Cys-motif partner protein
MNRFGGDWTSQKIEIVVEYTQAYLQIMESRSYWKLLYFDGFAGSGTICQESDTGTNVIEGAAKRILAINEPRSFDTYYFVEKTKTKAQELREMIDRDFFDKKPISHVAEEDCNEKLKDMANFLNGRGKAYKVLAFIDPCGMQLKWESLAALEGFSVDTWILVPLGMGVARVLTNDGQISESWMNKLEAFLGMQENEIRNFFYESYGQPNIFGGEDEIIYKKEKTIEKAGELYRTRMKTIFKHVSQPFLMKNSNNNIMYHFILGSNNKTAVKIADDVVRKWSE